jgi:hypothetical protein
MRIDRQDANGRKYAKNSGFGFEMRQIDMFFPWRIFLPWRLGALAVNPLLRLPPQALSAKSDPQPV